MMNVIFRVGMLMLVLTCGSVNATPSFNCKVSGLAGGLWQDGQSPLIGDSYPASQARQRLAVLAQATDTIRLYDAESDLEAACIAKTEFGMNVFLGIWIDSDVITNDAQITSGITAAQNGCVDALIVGNEVLLRGDQSPGYLAETIHSIKAQVPSTIKVGTAEVWDRLVRDKQVIDAAEILLIHAHSYWAGVATDDAVSYANKAYQAVKRIAGDREVILGEVGIPTAGQTRGASVPGISNLNQFLLEMTTWANAENIKVLFFAGFDENWKSGEPGEVGTHWGIFNSDMSFKAGLEDVFDCLVQHPDIEPIPTPACEDPLLQVELLSDSDMGSCSWTPGWWPGTSGTLCLTNQHDRSGTGGRGYYNYTADGSTGTGAFANQQQTVAVVGNVGYQALVHVRAWDLENGPAVLRVLFRDVQNNVVVGDESTVHQEEIDAYHEEWYPLTLSFEKVPCAANSAEIIFGVRKDEPGFSQVRATFDDASLVGWPDNCSEVENPDQLDSNIDGIGDACQCGDMNGDGVITNTDAVLIQRHLLGLTSPFNPDLCDVNGDGNCSNTDAVIIKREVLGLPPGAVQSCQAAMPAQ